MGISSAPEIFQRAMQEVFGDLEGVETIMDDLLVHGATIEEHNRRLRKVLQHAREKHLKLNKKKNRICQSEVPYVGHLPTAEGLKPSPERVKAIANMRQPTNHSELETILGMVAYVAKFIPNPSELNAPLHKLKTQFQWSWGPEENQAFQNIKTALWNAPVLQYYDVNQPVTLSVDASTKGLGAAILQKKVVAYATRALTPTEQRYAQIEKEMLAVVFGCTRFHQMIYGKTNVTIQTDHKPLEALHGKHNAYEDPAHDVEAAAICLQATIRERHQHRLSRLP